MLSAGLVGDHSLTMKADSRFAWLDQTGFFTIHPGLERVTELVSRLGNPQNALRFLHVAGSNGKGSVCALTEAALRHTGFKTGFYCSPHLVRLNERFRINGEPVTDEKLLSAAERVRTAAEQMRLETKEYPTYFELTTAIALVLFASEKVDFVVWETGMGGRLDATNIVRPLACVITGISLEHTAWLGPTLAAVAGEKAGILKPGVPVIRGPMPEEASRVIDQRAAELHCPLTAVLPYSGAYRIDRTCLQQELELEGVSFATALPGTYQRNNASVAFHTVRILGDLCGFDWKHALTGFRSVRWPARFQNIPEKNLILDGAHNPEGMQALAAALREFFPGEMFHFKAGCFADKNAEEVVAAFAPLAADVEFIPFDGAGREVCRPEYLGSLLARFAPGARWKEVSLEQSLAGLPASDGKRSVICGSLHLCGEVLESLGLPG